MVDLTETDRRIVGAAMAVTAAKGWAATTMIDIAAESGLSLADVYRRFPSKPAILAGLARLADMEVLSEPDEDLAGQGPRDRLFDVVMRRFDALAPFKPGVRAVRRDLARDPLTALALTPVLARSMAWLLEAAGLSASGPVGALRVKGLAAVWLATQRVWLEDDSPDLGNTMKELDQNLQRAESLARTLRIDRDEAGGAFAAGGYGAGDPGTGATSAPDLSSSVRSG